MRQILERAHANEEPEGDFSFASVSELEGEGRAVHEKIV
jgi:hypothetical protein